MSKYTGNDLIEEDGMNILKNALESNYFLITDFGKDKYPDIDGWIRLRDGNGIYLNQYLHYQLKSKEKLKDAKYPCRRRTINYLLGTNVPTLLFVVEVSSKKVFWYYLDAKSQKALNLTNDGRGRTIDLSNSEVNNNSQKLNMQWKKIAKPDDYDQLSNSLDKIVSDFKSGVTKCVGLLYLLQQVTKNELPLLFNKILNIGIKEVDVIIGKLNQEGIINDTVNLYLSQNEQLGIESLFELLKDLDLKTLESVFDKKEDRKIILRQLSKIKHPSVDRHLLNLTGETLHICLSSNDNDEMFICLELLSEYIYRVPKRAIKIIQTIVNSPHPLSPTFHDYQKLGKFEGKSHSDLIIKCVELLNDIRYLETKTVIVLLLKLAMHSNDDIKSKAKEALMHLSQYNLFVLQKIGYYPQNVLLEIIGKWNNKRGNEHFEILLEITKQLLQPSFEGQSAPDSRTITLHYGPLPVNQELKAIREQTINLLKKIYSTSKDLTQKQRVLQVMREATQTPHRGNYSDDMEQMVLNDTNSLINYYMNIANTAENEIIKDIEEQAHWFISRFEIAKLPEMEQLQSILASNKEYELFRVCVGYDYKFNGDLNWDEAQRIRSRKIQEFIDDMSDANYKDWQRKILFIRKNYSVRDSGEFQYYNMFLFELGKQKPFFALKLLLENENELEPFLTYLIAGIWKSSETNIAKSIMSEWVEQNRHLPGCAWVFEYIEEIDIPLLKKVFKMASKNKDAHSLKNIISAVVRNYPKYSGLQSVFISAIKELTKSDEYDWVNYTWGKIGEILKTLTEKDFSIILNNLLIAPSIEHRSEEVLLPIAERHPEKIIAFFYKRVKSAIKKRNYESQRNRYEPLPFRLYKLNKPLQRHTKTIVQEISTWFSKKDWLFGWEGGHFLQKIFPSFTTEFERELIRLIKSGTARNSEIVRSVLKAYQGEVFLHKVCREFIKQYPDNDIYRKEMFLILSQTGVVSGEYGFVEAYKQKKQVVQDWKNDKSKSIRTFVNKYEKFLDKRIDYEQKLADEEVALRR